MARSRRGNNTRPNRRRGFEALSRRREGALMRLLQISGATPNQTQEREIRRLRQLLGQKEATPA